MNRQSRVLTVSVGLSILLHALALSVHFRFPDALGLKANSQPLEVFIVNAKTKQKPSRREALAQANLDGGGNVDEQRRAKTPLPATQPADAGADLAQAKRRQQELETQQQRLLAQARESSSRVQADAQQAPTETPQPQASGRDLADLSLAAMRLQAQLDKRLEEYQKRPRKNFIGARATEYRFAQYEEDWRAKVERVGTLNFPAEARGKLYGNLRLSVSIRADGSVDAIDLERSSGLKVLDQAAFRIVRMASPYAAFPDDIRRDTDILVITRTWFFGPGDKIWTE
ncbi:MAG: TonB family protein [Betaproteobacteria bacterium]|nr:TonB family protein [Betaproteobacteria bacterium]